MDACLLLGDDLEVYQAYRVEVSPWSRFG